MGPSQEINYAAMNHPRPAEQMACGSPLGDDHITFLWLRSFISPTLLHLCIVSNALEVSPTCCSLVGGTFQIAAPEEKDERQAQTGGLGSFVKRRFSLERS